MVEICKVYRSTFLANLTHTLWSNIVICQAVAGSILRRCVHQRLELPSGPSSVFLLTLTLWELGVADATRTQPLLQPLAWAVPREAHNFLYVAMADTYSLGQGSLPRDVNLGGLVHWVDQLIILNKSGRSSIIPFGVLCHLLYAFISLPRPWVEPHLKFFQNCSMGDNTKCHFCSCLCGGMTP